MLERAAEETAFHSSLISKELGKHGSCSWPFAPCTLASVLCFVITSDAKYSAAYSPQKAIKGSVKAAADTAEDLIGAVGKRYIHFILKCLNKSLRKWISNEGGLYP